MSNQTPSKGLSTNFLLFLILLGLASCVYVALNIGEKITPTESAITWNVSDLVTALFEGTIDWPFASWFVLTGIILVLVFGISVFIFAFASGKNDYKPEGKSVLTMTGLKPALRKAQQIYGSKVTNKTVATYIVLVAYLGAAQKKPLYVQLEDSMWVYAPARAGKTLGIAVPLMLQAQGPLLNTSTKIDNFVWTAIHREKLGEVVVFDLEDITGWPSKVRYTPIFGCEVEKEAVARGKAWAKAAPMEGTKNGSFFENKAGTILSRLLHAAAIDNRPMREFVEWVFDPQDDEPINILLQHGKSPAFIQALRERTSSRAGETADSIESTLVTLVEPLVAEDIMCQFDFRPDEAFNIDKFLEGSNSLYLVVDGDDSPLGSLSTMFADQIYRAARKKSQQQASGRLWPVFTMVLDEATNVAAFSKMGQLLSDSGGRGIQVIGISQTKDQNEERWGKNGAEIIEKNANLKILFPGTDSDHLKKYASEMGQKKESRRSVSSSRGGGSTTHSTERIDVARPEQLKQLDPGKVTLAYRSAAPQVVHLEMLWQRKDFKNLVAQRDEALRRCGKVFADQEAVDGVKK
ncbi:UNVERIFIED_CONTAM: TraM recognition domain-containing protein [Actinomycetes bacterium ARC8]|nr:TraM recognition domain-containing protein [Actinomycetes bacterium ARC8]